MTLYRYSTGKPYIIVYEKYIYVAGRRTAVPAALWGCCASRVGGFFARQQGRQEKAASQQQEQLTCAVHPKGEKCNFALQRLHLGRQNGLFEPLRMAGAGSDSALQVRFE